MGTSKKGNQRKDKFYSQAKQMGYRSRAVFKLIQINKKYNFLAKSRAVIDLCAAPGGWLQVCQKFAPDSCKIIGVDLDKIKSIPGVTTFVDDITTSSCQAKLKKELNGIKADAVLNDGAPNVGQNWQRDSFIQNELVLHSLKIAARNLRKGGIFVSKVFRSQDYNSLIWVLEKFFESVEANKPKASRMASAEIFIVCTGYLAPDYIDENLFDYKQIFADTEADHQNQQLEKEITNIDKILMKRRKRVGYTDDMPMNMSRQIKLSEFINIKNPFVIFLTHTQIKIDVEENNQLLTQEIKEYMEDIQVLGKREITMILKFRNKLIQKNKNNQEKIGSFNVSEANSEAISDDNIDNENNIDDIQQEESQEEQDSQLQEMEQNLIDLQKEKINQQRKEKRQFEKNTKQTGGVKTQFDNFEDQELFNLNEHEDVQDMDFIDLDEQETNVNKKAIGFTNDKELQNQLDVLIQNKKIKKGKKQNKNNNLDLDEETNHPINKLKAKQLKFETKQAEYKEGVKLQNIEEDVEKFKQNYSSENLFKIVQKKKWYDEDLFNNTKQFKDTFNDKIFQNPLNKQEKQQQVNDNSEVQSSEYDENSSGDIVINKREDKKRKILEAQINKIDPKEQLGEELSDDQYDLNTKSGLKKRREKLKKQNKTNDKEQIEKQTKDDGFEIVKKMEDYDIDSLANTLALAKNMLNKRKRNNIIDSTFSRYAQDDHDNLPKWFVEDEQKHNFKHLPVTKTQVSAERERLLALNAKSPKKIIEAKIRNQMRVAKKIKKAKDKANKIMEQEGMSENLKLRQVQSIYKKEMATKQKEVKYNVSRKHLQSKKNQHTKAGTKNVDPRMKKEKRAQKKLNKGIFKNKNKKVSKRRQIKRH